MQTLSLRLVGHRAVHGLVATFLILVCIPAAAQQPPRPPLSEVERAIHLLNRTTYGAREEDVQEVLRVGRSAWLERQLTTNYPPPVPGGLVVRRAESTRGNAASMVSDMRNALLQRDLMLAAIRAGVYQSGNLIRLKIDRAARSQRQLEEVMTDFWFNHFNVDFRGAYGAQTVADYEDVIWRHAFGRFEDLLIGTARQHVPYGESAPTGYPTTAEDWVSAGAMLTRLDFAWELSRGQIGAFRFEASDAFRWIALTRGASTQAAAPDAAASPAASAQLTGAVPEPLLPEEVAAAVMRKLLYGITSERLHAAIAADLTGQSTTDVTALVSRAVALTLGSPEFQRY